MFFEIYFELLTVFITVLFIYFPNFLLQFSHLGKLIEQLVIVHNVSKCCICTIRSATNLPKLGPHTYEATQKKSQTTPINVLGLRKTASTVPLTHVLVDPSGTELVREDVRPERGVRLRDTRSMVHSS